MDIHLVLLSSSSARPHCMYNNRWCTTVVYHVHETSAPFRIERALLDNIWMWYYVPFMFLIASMHAVTDFFGWGCLHAVTAFNLWSYNDGPRRVDLCISIVLCMTLYALENLVWDQFFKFIRV